MGFRIGKSVYGYALVASNERSDNETNSLDQRIQQLISQGRAGDEDAIATLLNEHRKYLLLIANKQIDDQIRGKIGCSDIVQETLITAQDKFASFLGDDLAQLKAWLRQILINDVYEAGRRFKGTEKRQISRERQIQFSSSIENPLVDPNYTPRTNAIQDEESCKLQSAMSQLPADYQQVIKLRNWEQLTFKEIGEQMSRGEDAARKLWTRAILKLQEILPT